MQAAAMEATRASSTEGFPNFDEKEEGYGWILNIDRFWNTRGTPEVQRLQEAENGLSGRPLRWCRLWKQRNPNATLSNFQLAFLHRYSCFSDVLPLIEQSEVSDWELEAEEEATKKEDETEDVLKPEQRVEIEIFLKNEVTIRKQQPKLDREDEAVYVQQVEDKRDGMVVGVNINICKPRDHNDELRPPPEPPDTEKTEEETTKKLAELASTTQPPEPPDSVTTAMSVAAATKGRNRRGEMFGVVREIQASRVTWGLRPPPDLPAESRFSPAATKMVEVALMRMLRALHAVIVAAKELPPPKPPYSPASRREAAGFAWKKKNTVAENLLGGCCVEEERKKTDHKVGRASMDAGQILDPMGQAHITRERNKTYDEGSSFVKLMSPSQNCKVKLNKLKMAIVKSEGPLAEPFVFSIYKPFKWAVSILYFEGSSYFYIDLTLLNKTRELATKKDVTALQDHQKTEFKKFMSLWNNDKAFRNDYEKGIFPSLDMHQLSGDGRTRKVIDLMKKADQYEWLERDLASVDRSITPWLVATWHPPWYSTFKAHYREAECMRVEMEDLLYSYGVDIVFNGHVHAYERSNRVYNYSLDPCGPVYVTVGDGGNREKMSVRFADEPGHCPDPSSTPDPYMGGSCASNFSIGPGMSKFCWDRQPDYSAFRESSFGHGILEVKNETWALWTWYRNQDSYNKVGDQIYIVRQPELCPVHQKGNRYCSAAI